jgi:hypothetical protein
VLGHAGYVAGLQRQPHGRAGALKLESFFVGQVVGSFSRLRPAAEITRQIIGDCEVRVAELAALLPAGAPAAP